MSRRIVAALVWKEAQRYWHNRPSLVLGVLLVLVSILVSAGQEGGPLGRGAGDTVCYVLYWNEDDFVRHLRTHLPPGRVVRVKPAHQMAQRNGVIMYPDNPRRTSVVSIQLRPGNARGLEEMGFEPVVRPGGPVRYHVWYWHPDGRAEDLQPYREWFNARMRAFFEHQPPIAEASSLLFTDIGQIKPIHRVLTALVTAAVYLLCFHLNILITSEERERKTLTAQMLTPVSVADVLAAKFVFYVPATALLAAAVLAMNYPAALSRPMFWATILIASVAYLSIGLTICSLTRGQSAAGLTALTYLMLFAITIFLANLIPVFHLLANAFVDFHLMQLVLYSVVDHPPWYARLHLAALLALSTIWAMTAVRVFLRRGWR